VKPQNHPGGFPPGSSAPQNKETNPMKLYKTLISAAGLLALSVFAAQSAFAHGAKVGNLELHHPHSMATLPNAPVAGGFLTIVNTGKEADRLIDASSPAAGEMQIHEMAMEGEVMKMRQLPNGIEIPAGGTVELKKGGLHVMFMQLKHGFKEGDMIKATLVFEKAGSVDVEFSVDAMGKEQAGHHAAAADMAQPADANMAIPMVMKALFETPEKPLSVEPVIVDGDWAIASWAQDGKGGRALLKKGEKGWAIHLCSGASLKDAAALHKMGIAEASATKLSEGLNSSEATLGAEKIALFDSFEGTMMISEDAGHNGGHDAHKEHKK
jgi:periplasmic copper chaperone A